MDLEKLRREEEEAEKMWQGGGVENPSEEALSPDNSDDTEEYYSEDEEQETTESTQVITQEDDYEEEYESTKKQPRVSWKKRFASYKSTTDATIYTLRQEKAKLQAKLADTYDSVEELKKTVRNLKSQVSSSTDPYADIISDEDRELLGDEAVDVIKKVIGKRPEDPRIIEMQEELEDLKKEKRAALRREQEELQRTSQTSFKERLMKAVRNFKDIDGDPEFHEYLKGMDDYSGAPRSKLFASAVASKDVMGTARFYSDFNNLKPKTREEILSSKVKPTGSGASSSEGQGKTKKTYSINEYSRFMDDVSKGKYRGREKEAKKMEMIFDRAFQEGRVK